MSGCDVSIVVLSVAAEMEVAESEGVKECPSRTVPTNAAGM